MSLLSVKDYEIEAKKKVPSSVYSYFSSGAISEHTLKENETLFNNWYIQPRYLRDVSKRSMETTILGHKIKVPFGIAPFGSHKLAHSEGEIATVRAAAKHETVFTQSTGSNFTIEEIANESSKCLKFFQLYIYKDRNITKTLVERAEKAGFKALVVTIDAQVLGVRYAVQRENFQLPKQIKMANFLKLKDEFATMKALEDGSSLSNYLATMFDPSITWKDIKWLKGITFLPIVVKGILTAADAELAIENGVDAIWVSNHGGRQIDGVAPTIEALPKIAKVVENRCEIYADSGFRTGSDIFKGLALGAKVVFFGKPIACGLACEGEKGVDNILKILSKELDSVMALSGCNSVSDITRDMVELKNLPSHL